MKVLAPVRGLGRRLRVAVTGASGFVGGHLAVRLAQRGFAVSAILRGGHPAPHLEAPGVDVIVSGDVTVALSEGFDAVVHAAATSPVQGTTASRLVSDNIDLSRGLIAGARGTGVSCFILLSSMSVYGRLKGPLVDESTPKVDVDLYGLTKRVCEELLEENCGPMAGLSIRLPAVIGRGAARHWLAESARKLALHEDLRIFHPTAPFNNAIHVTDLATLIGDVIERRPGGYGAVNVASDGEVSVLEAVATLHRLLASRSRILEVASDRSPFMVSIAQAVARYGFRPMSIGEALTLYATEIAGSIGSGTQGRNQLDEL